MIIRYRVDLSEAEQAELEILLAANAGVSDEAIARTVSPSGSTVHRTKRPFIEGNLELALNEGIRP